MDRAVANYATYRMSDDVWALGRFILPVMRLEEWQQVIARMPADGAGPWRLSVLGSGDLAADLMHVQAFNHHDQGADGAIIDAIELKATSAGEIAGLLAGRPSGLDAYVEIPLDDALAEMIGRLAEVGGWAKVRTGGVTSAAFPTAAALLSFINGCHAANVAFKATAGLHHPLRSTYPLTYEATSAVAPMFGFLNLFLCAAFIRVGVSPQEAVGILEESAPSAFQFRDDGVSWGPHHLLLDDLQRTRRTFALSFGSCSFTEPIDELKAINLL